MGSERRVGKKGPRRVTWLVVEAGPRLSTSRQSRQRNQRQERKKGEDNSSGFWIHPIVPSHLPRSLSLSLSLHTWLTMVCSRVQRKREKQKAAEERWKGGPMTAPIPPYKSVMWAEVGPPNHKPPRHPRLTLESVWAHRHTSLEASNPIPPAPPPPFLCLCSGLGVHYSPLLYSSLLFYFCFIYFI